MDLAGNGLTSAQTPQDVLAAGRRLTRAVYEYDVPLSLQIEGISAIGLVELTANDELMAANRASGASVQLAYELAKESVRLAVRGNSRQNVSTADGTADVLWAKMGAPLRSLVLQAYAEIHTPRREDVSSFLASRRVTTG